MSLAWLGLTAVMAVNQRKMVFNPAVEPEVRGPKSSGHKTRTVVLRAADGTRLSGWLMTPETAGPHAAVLYFGGRSEEVSWVVRDAGRLFPGMAVLAVNYRGYGESLGNPGETAMVADGTMLFDWLSARSHIDAAKIALVGRSLGSGVAVQVAKERAAHSVVLITPYDSILALAKRKFRGVPIGLVLKHRFESSRHVAMLKIPVYILRAATDDVVPHAHTDVLVSKLATLWCEETIPDSDHYTIPYLPETQLRIARFLLARFTDRVMPSAHGATG